MEYMGTLFYTLNIIPGDFPINEVWGNCVYLFYRIDGCNSITAVTSQGEYLKSTVMDFYIKDTSRFIEGIYDLKTVLFFREGEDRHFYAMSNPYNFILTSFAYKSESLSVADSDQIKVAKKDWIDRVSFGLNSSHSSEPYFDVFIICADALITKNYRIGPAELYPIEKAGAFDLAASMKEALILLGQHILGVETIVEKLYESDDRRSPLFILRFPMLFVDQKGLTELLIPIINKVFGILCLNRSAYPKTLGSIVIERMGEKHRIFFINHNSYYRGNLIGGSIAKEKIDVFNQQYNILSCKPELLIIFEKLHSAFAETDLDISYFRLWSILEYTANIFKGDKKRKTIEKMIIDAYENKGGVNAIVLKIGSEEFTFTQLIEMWINWRDLTAHHGGIRVPFRGKSRVCSNNSRMIKAMQQLGLRVDYGEDRSNLLLKDVCLAVVEYSISSINQC